MYFPHFVPVWFQKMLPGILWSGKQDGPYVHLTFDDGPIPEVTPWILDELKKFGQKATFFCVGDNVKKYPDIYVRILNEGHSVGNHTFHHINGWHTKKSDYLDDIALAGDRMETVLFRPPYGKLSLGQYLQIRKKYQIVMWTYLSGDFDPDFQPETCMRQVANCSRNGCILVFHDNLKTIDNLKLILPEILMFYKKQKITSLAIR
jgi:peptidoglycan/xylan/chitin deacetylase (PgdA/CDA1 family)